MDAFEQLRLTHQSQNTSGKGKPLGGALGAMLGSLGLKLQDVDSFSLRNPNGLFTSDVDMMNLFRNTKMGEIMGKAHGEFKQAAEKIKIELGESVDDFQGSGLVRKSGGAASRDHS